jgi:type I restriction enzyme, S subunit
MKARISSFLTERQDRFKPEEANNLGLKRLNKIDFSGNMHLVDKPTNTNMILIKKGDLVISGINIEKGAIAIYQGNEDITATIHYSSYEFDKNKIDVDYFKWFLKSAVFRKIIQTQIKGGIKTELKPKKFLPLEIELPRLSEQKEILKKINSLKEEASQIKSNISKDVVISKKLRQVILQEAVQGKLVPQDSKDETASELLKKIKAEKERLIKEGKIKRGKELLSIGEDEIPHKLPKGWEWCRLVDICNSISAGGDKPQDFTKERTEERNIPVIANGETNEGIIGYTKEAKVFDKSITVSGRGTIGYSCIRDFPYNPIVRLIVLIPNKNIDIDFLKCTLSATLEVGSGSSIPQLTVPMIKPRMVPIPPFAEQKRIVEKVNSLMKMCDELWLKIKESKKGSEILMSAVLKEVFEE